MSTTYAGSELHEDVVCPCWSGRNCVLHLNPTEHPQDEPECMHQCSTSLMPLWLNDQIPTAKIESEKPPKEALFNKKIWMWWSRVLKPFWSAIAYDPSIVLKVLIPYARMLVSHMKIHPLLKRPKKNFFSICKGMFWDLYLKYDFLYM